MVVLYVLNAIVVVALVVALVVVDKTVYQLYSLTHSLSLTDCCIPLQDVHSSSVSSCWWR